MNSPRLPEDLDLLLSCDLDGELDPATRLELEDWLATHPGGRDRLSRLREVATALSGLEAPTEVPAGWTARAYRIGIPEHQPWPRRMMLLGLGQALARPRVLGHGQGRRRVLRRWTLSPTHLQARPGERT